MLSTGPNGGGYYNDVTDLLDFNLANTPTSVTSSITVSSVVGSLYLSFSFLYLKKVLMLGLREFLLIFGKIMEYNF